MAMDGTEGDDMRGPHVSLSSRDFLQNTPSAVKLEDPARTSSLYLDTSTFDTSCFTNYEPLSDYCVSSLKCNSLEL